LKRDAIRKRIRSGIDPKGHPGSGDLAISFDPQYFGPLVYSIFITSGPCLKSIHQFMKTAVERWAM